MLKTKVLILCGSLNTGGAEKVAQSIAVYGDTDRYEYHYLVFHRSPGFYEAALSPLGCFIHRFSEPSENYFVFIRDLVRLLHSQDFQVIHAHTMFHCGIVMLCAYLCRVPVRISHAHSSLSEKRSFLQKNYEAVMRFLILRFSTDLVSCSKFAGQRLYGKRNFLLIPNGIDTDCFAFREKTREALRSSLHLTDAFVIGHTGRMVPVKNQIFLLDLMPELLKRQPNAVLLLLGDGEDMPMLRKRIRLLNITDHVILAGNRSDISGYLSAMDVFILPSLFEGMPLSLLEAQANGLPCVVADTISPECFATGLIQTLSLTAPAEDWITAILSSKREHSEQYSRLLQNTEFSVTRSIAAIHQIYRKSRHDQHTVSDRFSHRRRCRECPADPGQQSESGNLPDHRPDSRIRRPK